MGDISRYLLSVIAAAIVCGIVNGLAEKAGALKSSIKLITGLCMVLTVVNPLVNIRVSSIDNFTESIQLDAEDAVQAGEQLAAQSMIAIIKEDTEAYILDKAAALGLTLKVEVTVSETQPYAPCGVSIAGPISPYNKSNLSKTIEEDLGIPKEAQKWTG